MFISIQTHSNRLTDHTRLSITPIKEAPQGFEGAGYGRIIRYLAPQDLGAIAIRVARGLGDLSGLSVAVPQSTPTGQTGNIKISSVGICVGSGGSMLNGIDVDLLLTGELSHHEALAAIEQGKCVITTFHSNTERAFLKGKMKPALTAELKTMATDSTKWGLEEGFDIAVSEVDRDPFEIITRSQLGL
jgi:putative NIF3 family GTP cyclohydrolase 1 type 2